MLKNILKISIRNILKHRTFTGINIVGLAIGLTAFLLINLYVQFERSYDAHLRDSDRLYRLTTDQYVDGKLGVRDAMSFAPSGKVLVDELPEVISATTTYKFGDIIFRQGERITVESYILGVDSAFLDHFTYDVIYGDPGTMFTEPYSIVLTKTKAREYLGEGDVTGQTIELMSGFQREFVVTGVIEDIPPNTHYGFDILISLSSIQDRVDEEAWSGYNYYTYLKLEENVVLDPLREKMPEMAKKYIGENSNLVFNLQPVTEIHLYSDLTFEPEIHGNAKTVNFLEIISILILIIAWVNYINLSTARSVERAKEVGLRKVVGAQKEQIFLQFLTEAMIINFIGILIAFGLGELMLPFFNQLIGKQVAIHIWSDPSFLLILGAFFVIGSFISGFYPSIVLSGFKPITVLKGKFKNTNKGVFLRKGLVIVQFAASIALIAATFVVQDQVNFMLNKDKGIDTESVIAFGTPFVPREQRDVIRERLSSFKEVMRSDPSIIRLGATSNLPGGGSSDINSSSGPVKIAGITEPIVGTTYIQYIDEGFIPTMGLKIIAGRNYKREFEMDTATAIVNEAFLRKFSISDPESILLESIQFGNDPDNDKYPIVGVVNDFNRTTLKNNIEPTIYFNFEHPGNIIAKLDVESFSQGVGHIEGQWKEFFPDYPFEYVFIDDRFEALYKEERQFGTVFSSFSILALIVASLGLFGLSSFTAVQRTKEMGIRKVLGASIPGITLLFYREFLWLTLAALGLGMPAVYLSMESWLSNYTFRIDFPWIWLGVSLGIVLITSFVTVSYQVYKVARLNPTETLRYE